MNDFEFYAELYKKNRLKIEKKKLIKIDSPLEQAFIGFFISKFGVKSVNNAGDIENNHMEDHDYIKAIIPQHEVFDPHAGNRYVIDFLIICNSVNENDVKANEYNKENFPIAYNENMKNIIFNVAVETDGLFYHREKTKEEIIYRNERDLCIQKHGWKVMHILSDPMRADIEGEMSKLYRFINYTAQIKREQ